MSKRKLELDRPNKKIQKIDPVVEKNPVEGARDVLQRLKDTKLDLKQKMETLSGIRCERDKTKDKFKRDRLNSVINDFNLEITSLGTTLKRLETRWNRIKQDDTLWNQVCTRFMKEKFTTPNVLDNLQILWPATLLPDDAHENIAFLMGLNFASRVLNHGVESYKSLNEFVLKRKLTREQVLQHITASLPQIDHQVINSRKISCGYTLDQKISLNTYLYRQGKEAINSGYLIAYAFIIGVTILHECGHFKLRLHDEPGKKRTSPKKFMKESGDFVETDIFGGVWEHRPLGLDFSNMNEIILVVGKRYFSIPLRVIHTLFCSAFWITNGDEYLPNRFKKMFVIEEYDITNRIEKEKKKEIQSILEGTRQRGHDETNPDIVY
jgi:hypothetical protein